MKPQFNRLLLLVALFFVPVFKTKANHSATDNHSMRWLLSEEAFLQEQFRLLELPFTCGYDEQVGRVIRQYLVNGKRQTEAIMGRAAYYFPIFDKHLQDYGLPVILKYLPIVESGLRPGVKSGVGAAGLWQFMPVTARYFDLEINRKVDERRDPYLSTEAAVRFLSKLYGDFGDWALALAAYNCGPGRVRRAIKKAGSNQYEAIEPFLPKQTRHYIIKFKAVAFVATYYQFFGLNPRMPSHDTRKVELIRVSEELTFGEIADASGTELSTIRALNPAFLREVVPARPGGRMIALPRTAAQRLLAHLRGVEWQEPVTAESEELKEDPESEPAGMPTAGMTTGRWKEILEGVASNHDRPPLKYIKLQITNNTLPISHFQFPLPAPEPGPESSVLATAWSPRQNFRFLVG